MSRINVVLFGKEGEAQYEYNPATSAAQVYITAENGSDSNLQLEIENIRATIAEILNGGISFKGALTSTVGLPTINYKAGWQYVVQEAGTYAGIVCEVGDMVICIKDYASGSASNKDWNVLQVNLVGALTGPASSVANHVATFDGTSGKIIKDSGFTIAKSVPADAEFTDTTYAAASASANGLMTSAQYTKLSGIEAGADVTDAANVSAAGAFMLASNTSDNVTEGTSNLYMTTAERNKLSGINAGAEVNQNAFSSVVCGGVTLNATSKSDSFSIAGGEGITVSADTSADKITVAETYIDSCIVTDLSNVPSNLRDGGLIILKS